MGDYEYPVYINGVLRYRCLRQEDAIYCVARWNAAHPDDVCEIFHAPFEPSIHELEG